MTSITIDGYDNVFRKNEAFCKSFRQMGTTIKNNHTYIGLNDVHKAAYSRILNVVFVKENNILAYCLTKWVSGMKQWSLYGQLLY